MKKLLLLTVVSAFSLPVLADEVPAPKVFENSCAYALSPDGQYLVSESQTGMKIIEVATGNVYDYGFESEVGIYGPGIGKCVSSNGIVVGYSENDTAEYWKDGEWTLLDVPEFAVLSNMANAITPDGSRICGNLGTAAINYDDDVLMQAGCVWNWNAEKGDYDEAIMLPRPELDFTGRVPQYVTAVDISSDGKTIIGQVVNATGMYRYPIIYRENENGEWSYTLPDLKNLQPEGSSFPEYPGEAPAYPNATQYMTPAEVEAYNEAVAAWRENADYSVPYPEATDFMSPEELEEYNKALAEYEKEMPVWDEAFNAWMAHFYEIVNANPQYEFNSIRISPDGKNYANTVQVLVEDDDPLAWYPFKATDNIWIFDSETGEVVKKYDQKEDFVLTYLADGAVALAAIERYSAPKSMVLADGEAIQMQEWISSKIPAYGSYISENFTFEMMKYEWNSEIEDYEMVYYEDTLTGRAFSNPDLSIIALGLENVWDFMDDGVSAVFDMAAGNAVSVVRPADAEKTVFDLSGRKLKDASAPGIYIIDGKKKVVR